MNIENVVIAYTADISDILFNVKRIQVANADLAKGIGLDLAKGFTVINDELKKIQLDKTFKIKEDGNFKKIQGDILTFEKTVVTADGQVAKFTRTIGINEDGMHVLGETVRKTAQQQNILAGQSSQLATNFKNFSNINQTFSKELEKFGKVSTFVGTSFNKISSEGASTAKIFETVDGKFVKLTETISRTPDGVQKVTRSVQEMSRSQVENASTLENANKRTVSFTENIIRLGKRALLTIPIWFALRTAITAPLRAIRDGLKDLAEFDRALQLLGKTLKVSADDFAKTFEPIRDEITKFSLESGQSVEKITTAIQKFATVGFDLETSLKGGIQATKVATLLFGDAEETARAFARALRILVDTGKPVEQQQKEIAESLSLMEILWDKNEFEISDANEALTKFASVAKVSGLSMKETLTLLATLGTAAVSGSRGGTLLNTTIQKLIENLDEVAKEFNIGINPATDTTFSTLVKIVDASANLGTSFQGVIARSKILTEVFGGVRGSVPIQALSALRDVLQENIALQPDLAGTEKRFQDQIETLNKLVERHKNLNREMKKAFVTGLLGAGNYQKAMLAIVNTQLELIDDTQRLGTTIRNSLLVVGTASVVAFQKQLLGIIPLFKSLPVLIATALATSLNAIELFQQLKEQADKEKVSFNEFGGELGDAIMKGLEGKLSLTELDELISQLEVFNNIRLADSDISLNFDKEIKALKELQGQEQTLTIEKEKQQAIDQQKAVNRKKEEEIVEELIKHELELLQIKGATTTQLIEADRQLRKQFNTQLDLNDAVQQELERLRAINEEKELGNSISDRSQKLADIARQNGIQTAVNISKVLSGQKDLNTFLRQGGKDVEIFKENFGDILKQEQDLAFLRGERVPGEKGLRGGQRITVPLADQALVAGTEGLKKQADLDKQNIDKFVSRFEALKNPIEENTIALKAIPQSIEELKQFALNGGRVSSQDIQRVSQQENIAPIAQRLAPTQPTPTSRTIDLNLSIDGKNLDFRFANKDQATQILKQVLSNDETVQRIVNNLFDKRMDEVLGDGTVVK